MIKLKTTTVMIIVGLTMLYVSPLSGKKRLTNDPFPKGTGGDRIELVKNGQAKMQVLVDTEVLPLSKELDPNAGKSPIDYVFKEEISGSSERRLAVIHLLDYIRRMSGVELDVKTAREGDQGIYVGRPSDFPWLQESVDTSVSESFIVKSKGGNLYLLGNSSLGVRAAVIYFLKSEGCRWFFPGETWEIVPSKATVGGAYNIAKKPDYKLARTLWYGWGEHAGMKGKPIEDYLKWFYFNGMGGPTPMRGGHSLYGIDVEKAKTEHPDWFAERDGTREYTGRQDRAKFCFSNPEVVEQMKKHTLDQAAKGVSAINLSPADGADFCECEKCQAVAGGKIDRNLADKSIRKYTLLAKRPDGEIVCVTSETYFRAVNEVARAVRQKYPDFRVFSYSYSSFAHPATFPMEPNVIIMTTTHFRYTPVSLEEQLATWGKRAKTIGIRDYWSVSTWDYEKPIMGDFNPEELQRKLKFYLSYNITGISTEARNNWGARGLSYYIGSNLLWDTDADIKALASDFFTLAFGPAATVMEKHYGRFYGPSVVASIPLGVKAEKDDDSGKKSKRIGEYVFVNENAKIITISRKTLVDGFKYLDEALRLVGDDLENRAYRDRIDHLRMYFYYLLLREQLQESGKRQNNEEMAKALKDMTVFSMSLFETNMVHSYALSQPRMFDWYSKPYAEAIKDIPEAHTFGKGWREIGAPAPTHEELNKLWDEGKKYLKL